MEHEAAYRQTYPQSSNGGVASVQLRRPEAPPVTDRLISIRSRLLQMNMHLIAFEQRMNGNPPEPQVNKISTTEPGYPPASIEDLLTQIEQAISDLDNAHGRIAQRF